MSHSPYFLKLIFLDLLLFSMRKNMRFEVCGLRKLLAAAVKWTDVRPVPRVDSDVGSEVKIEGKPFTAALESALKWLFPGMNKLKIEKSSLN